MLRGIGYGEAAEAPPGDFVDHAAPSHPRIAARHSRLTGHKVRVVKVKVANPEGVGEPRE